MKKGIIFDMDGTLWDSSKSITEAWNQAIEQSPYIDKKLTVEDIQGVMGKTKEGVAESLFGELDKKTREELFDRCGLLQQDYLRRHGGILYEGVEKTMRNLKDRGYHTYIVSNCAPGYIEAFLDHYQLWDCFEDIECYGNNQLQKWDNIRLVAERSGLEAAVYVGDIQADYEASCRAGVKFIHAAYGFGTIDVKVPRILSIEELQTLDIEAVLRA